MQISVIQHIEEDLYIVDPWRQRGTIKLIHLEDKDI